MEGYPPNVCGKLFGTFGLLDSGTLDAVSPCLKWVRCLPQEFNDESSKCINRLEFFKIETEKLLDVNDEATLD